MFYQLSFQVLSLEIDTMQAQLDQAIIPEMKGISACHHVFTTSTGQICYRSLACHCQRPASCLCFDAVVWDKVSLLQPHCAGL